MKKTLLLSCLVVTVAIICSFRFTEGNNKPVAIPYQQQFPGNSPDSGYWYLVSGDYLKSGLPYSLYKKSGMKETENYLHRTGLNDGIPYNFTTNTAPNGAQIVAPNCLYCHAQKWGDSLVIGMGNSLSDYTMPQDATMKMMEMAVNMMGSAKEKEAAIAFLKAGKASYKYMVAESKGVNVADRLTSVLAAHRSPETFQWIDKETLKIPEETIPTDVPAWWLLKKKNAMFYNGFGRGDFSRFLMASNLLTVKDTVESAEVLTHFDNVLAYIYTLKAPKYPQPINQQLAARGQAIFAESCSHCHGTYGANESYPNLLIPTSIVQTDSTLVNTNFSSSSFLDWFGKSWFTTGKRPASLVAFKGYIAPPLDGIWCTAPYLHNASVPNLETLLNSKERPTFWRRNFDQPEYDYTQVGWKYTVSDRQDSRNTYNTTLKGYSNTGHTFGDKLTNEERKAVIEYLKTL